MLGLAKLRRFHNAEPAKPGPGENLGVPARKWWGGSARRPTEQSAPVMCHLIPRLAPSLTDQYRGCYLSNRAVLCGS
jgi:hypothetical protein